MLRKSTPARVATMPVLFVNHAAAEAVCAERAEPVGRLEAGYAETRRSLDLATNGTSFGVFTPAKDTWSLPVTHPDGQIRLVATGEVWPDRKQDGLEKI